MPGAWQTLGYDTPVYTNIQYPIAVSTPPSMPRRNTSGVYARTVVPGAAAAAGALDGSRRCVLHFGAADNAAFVFAGGAWRALWKDARLPGEVRGGNRVIQGRFNMSGPRAIVPEKGSTLRGRSER